MARKRNRFPTTQQVVSSAWGQSYAGPPSVTFPVARTTGTIAQQIGTNEALADIFKMLIDRRWDAIDRRQERRSDMHDQQLSFQRYDAQHQDQMEETAYREYISNGGDPHEWSDYSKGLFGENGSSSNPAEITNGVAVTGGSEGKTLGVGTSGSVSVGPDEVKQLKAKAFAQATPQDQDMMPDDWFRNARDAVMGSKAANGTGESLWWVLDKISRPLYAVNAGIDYFYGLDTKGDKEIAEDWGPSFAGIHINDLGDMLYGKNPMDVWNDIDSPGDIFGAIKAMGKGFVDGGLGNADNPTLAQEIIHKNAQDLGDNPLAPAIRSKPYTIGAGLAFDIAGDPLSYVGFGIPSGVARTGLRGASKAAKELKPLDDALRATSDDAAKALTDAKVDPYFSGLSDSLFDAGKPVRAEQVYNLLGGNYKFTRNTRQKIGITRDVEQAVGALESQIRRAIITADERGSSVIQNIGAQLEKRRQEVLDGFKDDVFVEELRAEFAKAGFKNADAPTLEGFQSTLDAYRVSREIPRLRQWDISLNDAAKKLGFEGGTTKNNRILYTAYDRALSTLKYAKETGNTAEATRIEEGLKAAMEDLKPLDQLIPSLAADIRLTPYELADLYRSAHKLVRRDLSYDALTKRSKELANIARESKGGLANPANEGRTSLLKKFQNQLNAAETRKARVDFHKDMLHADIMVRLLKQRVSEAKTYSNPELAETLTKELNAILKEADTRQLNTADEIELQQRLTDVQNELRSLEGLPPSEKMDLAKTLPDEFAATETRRTKIGDLEAAIDVDHRVLNGDMLREHIKVTDEGEPRFKYINEGKGATDDWIRNVGLVFERHYDTVFSNKYRELMKDVQAAEDARTAKIASRYDEVESLDPSISPKRIKKSSEYYDARKRAVKEAAEYAKEQAYKYIEDGIKRGRLEGIANTRFELIGQPLNEEELLKALAWKRGSDWAEAQRKASYAKRGASGAEIREIDRQLSVVKKGLDAQKVKEQEALKKAKEARASLEKRLKEDALMRIAQVKVLNQKKALTLNTWGDHELFVIPGSSALFKAAEELGKLPILKQARQVWADAFKSPTSRLTNKELAHTRARAMVEPHVQIQLHVKHLTDTLGKHDLPVRKAAFRNWLNGNDAVVGERDAQEAIKAAFDDLMPYFRGEYRIGDELVTVNDINMFLPEGLKVPSYIAGNSNATAQHLVNGMAKHAEGKAAKKILDDPFELSWNLRIASELAMGRKAMQVEVKQMFGIRRGVNMKDGTIGHVLDDETTEVIEQFQKLGWEPAAGIDSNYLFPPEILPDIERLMDMMKPRNLTAVGKAFDRATGHWKLLTTIYNPGYWTRNGLGEFMSSWFAGLHDPKWYGHSKDLISYARHDSKDIEGIAAHLPGVKVKGNEELGKKVVTTIGHGKNKKQVTLADVWEEAHATGIKTNFFNTEFNENFTTLGSRARATQGTKQALAANDKLRSAGEWYEDYWRMAHFMHAIDKYGNKTNNLRHAAEQAAEEVRKYHFDYTDFTKFEKTVMLRAFPFYKWTRKALPLMMSMMFTKPGKFMAYNKGMNAISNSVSTGDIYQDQNGFAPNYEGIVPGWIQDIWAYQIAGESDGTGTFGRINTPQMDALQAWSNPQRTATGLLNPLLKYPMDEFMGTTMGHTLGKDEPNSGPEKGFEKDLNGRFTPDMESVDNLSNITPASDFIFEVLKSHSKSLNSGEKPRKMSTESWIKFLTGLGIYEDYKEDK